MMPLLFAIIKSTGGNHSEATKLIQEGRHIDIEKNRFSKIQQPKCSPSQCDGNEASHNLSHKRNSHIAQKFIKTIRHERHSKFEKEKFDLKNTLRESNIRESMTSSKMIDLNSPVDLSKNSRDKMQNIVEDETFPRKSNDSYRSFQVKIEHSETSESLKLIVDSNHQNATNDSATNSSFPVKIQTYQKSFHVSDRHLMFKKSVITENVTAVS